MHLWTQKEDEVKDVVYLKRFTHLARGRSRHYLKSQDGEEDKREVKLTISSKDTVLWHFTDFTRLVTKDDWLSVLIG